MRQMQQLHLKSQTVQEIFYGSSVDYLEDLKEIGHFFFY